MMLQQLYEEFLDAGFLPELFYRYSINEISDLVSSYDRRKKQEYEDNFKMWVMLLDVFGKNLLDKFASSMGQENVTYSMLEYFPQFFGNAGHKDDSKEETIEQLSPEMKIYKAKRIHDAYLRNQQRHREENNV